jgi:hypothetical protein
MTPAQRTISHTTATDCPNAPLTGHNPLMRSETVVL